MLTSLHTSVQTPPRWLVEIAVTVRNPFDESGHRLGYWAETDMRTIASTWKQIVAAAVVPFLIGSAVMLALMDSRVRAALVATVYPPGTNVSVSRSVAPGDLSAVSSGETITVVVDVVNGGDAPLRGFYYSDQVPSGWAVNTLDVTVNGSSIVDHSFEQGYPGEICTGCTPSRWALETPQGGGVFSAAHPIPASGSTARIAYRMTVAGGTGSDYSLEHGAWAGWLETSPGMAVFGYQDVAAPLRADFVAQPRLGVAPLNVQFTDLSTGDVLTRHWDFGDGGTASLPGSTHTYSALGTYTVGLTVYDAFGFDELVRARYIHVTDVIYDVFLPVVVR